MRRRRAPWATLLIAVLSMGVFSAQALAQDFVPPKPKAKSAPKQKAQGQVKPKSGPGSQTAPKGPTVRRSTRGSRRDAGFVMNPNAKWACDQQTQTLEPVWRSNKGLTWTFEIRNEGTSNLQIKARGG
jgi:hypothetical protein